MDTRPLQNWWNKPIFIFFLGQSVMCLMWIVGGMITTSQNNWRSQQEMTGFNLWKDEINSKIRQMEDQGTTYSHYNLQTISEISKANAARLDRLENSTRKLEVIEEKLLRVENDIKDIKTK